MYLVVIAILAIVLALRQPLYPLVADPGLIVAAVAAATLLPAAVGMLVARRAVYLLDRHPERPGRGQAAFGHGMLLIQILLAACHGGILVCTGWLPICRGAPVVGKWPLVPGMLTLIPFLLSILLVWIAVYPADRAVRQIALEVYLFRGRPLRPVWTLFRFLTYNLRHQVLFVLIPMMLILAAHDLIVHYQEEIRAFTRHHYAPDFLVGLAALAVAVVTPEILRWVWDTQRLPDGPLRDRLQLLARKLRLRCRDILVWRSGGMIVNAAVMGMVAPLRYVLITDAMLEQMDDTKIEAVFGHEAGHVKRHHIQFFLLFAVISGCAMTVFSARTAGLARANYELYQILVTVAGVVLALKWGVLFGWVSRRFERQADVFGVRTLAASGLPCTQPCLLHALKTATDDGSAGDRLCSTAAQMFSQALHEVAVLNGMRPEARSWRHSSISSRSRFLQQLAQDPRRTQRFERTVTAVKAAIFVAAVIGSLWTAYEMKVWPALAEMLTQARG